MAGGSSTPGRTVTSKVVALLDAFAPDHPQLTLSELCRRTGLPAATAHRLVGELVEWGGLERCASGGYRIGLRLYEVAALAPRGMLLRESALPFLEDLYEATHENVQLAVLDGLEAVCVERIAGRGALTIATRVGGRLPLHASGVGQVLLAHAQDERLLDRVVLRGLPAFTPHTLTSPVRLRQVLAEIRQTGVAVGREQFTLGAVSVAVPVLGPQRTVAAALSIVLPAGSATGPLVPILRSAARGIGHALGRPVPPAPPPGRPRTGGRAG